MICDDSMVIRAAIARMLAADPAIAVVGRVADGRAAIEALARHRPDVLVLDVEMPEMDGLTALPLLLREDPALRVVMASTLTASGADVTLRALRLGAADYIQKPSASALAGNDAFARELVAKIKVLAQTRTRRAREPTAPPARLVAAPAPARPPRLLAIGCSTGGPQALFTLMQGLGGDFPLPIVLTQHMPPAFTPVLADHISRLSGLPCAEARAGEALRPGRAYLAPGDRHLLVMQEDGRLCARLSDAPPENFCRPAVDPMLRSAAAACDGRVLAAILTGMGHDGLEGARTLVAAGGAVIAQDEASSVVWGMPGAVARAGLCHAVLPLPAIAPRLRAIATGAGRA